MTVTTAPNFHMKFQGTTLFKLVAAIGLVLAIVWIAFTSIKDIGNLPQKNEVIPTDTSDNSVDHSFSQRDSIVNYAMELLNTPYVEAGSDEKGFDCSGFIYYVFNHFSIDVPRSSPQYENFGSDVPIDQVKKGDILVFLSPTSNVIGHLGVVTNPKGMESDFIHATSGRAMKVVVTSLTVDGYKRRFVKAISVIN